MVQVRASSLNKHKNSLYNYDGSNRLIDQPQAAISKQNCVLEIRTERQLFAY
jgi:hypothetical protein